MFAAPTTRIAAVAAALALSTALFVAAPASAATITVGNQADLQAAFAVDGDTVVLSANITFASGQSLEVDPGEDITLDLNGFTLTVSDPGVGTAAIHVPPTSTLTINATGGGTLSVEGGSLAAGIGGNSSLRDGGTAIINGGTVTATGGTGGAGIGGGNNGQGGITTINAGTVTAEGGQDGAGIGGGTLGNGGTTTINGGTVVASSTLTGAGIGGGGLGSGGTVVLNGGTITAIGGEWIGDLEPDVDPVGGAGIGAGAFGDPGVLEVNGNPDPGAATTGGGPTTGSPITNPSSPDGVGYSATATATGVSNSGTLELQFNYVVDFVANGGTATASQTVDDGDTVTQPAAPTRAGFVFAGWTLDGDAYNFATPVTEPLMLTATWTAVGGDIGSDAELAATGAQAGALGLAALLLAGGLALLVARRVLSFRTR